MWLNMMKGMVKLKPMWPAASPIAAHILWGGPSGFEGMEKKHCITSAFVLLADLCRSIQLFPCVFSLMGLFWGIKIGHHSPLSINNDT